MFFLQSAFCNFQFPLLHKLVFRKLLEEQVLMKAVLYSKRRMEDISLNVLRRILVPAPAICILLKQTLLGMPNGLTRMAAPEIISRILLIKQRMKDILSQAAQQVSEQVAMMCMSLRQREMG